MGYIKQIIHTHSEWTCIECGWLQPGLGGVVYSWVQWFVALQSLVICKKTGPQDLAWWTNQEPLSSNLGWWCWFSLGWQARTNYEHHLTYKPLGITGNIQILVCFFVTFQVIVAVFIYPKLRRKCNVFVVNLALADACISYEVQACTFIGKFRYI